MGDGHLSGWAALQPADAARSSKLITLLSPLWSPNDQGLGH